MTVKELKDCLEKLPERYENTEVVLVRTGEDGFGEDASLDRVVYNSEEVLLWGEKK